MALGLATRVSRRSKISTRSGCVKALRTFGSSLVGYTSLGQTPLEVSKPPRHVSSLEAGRHMLNRRVVVPASRRRHPISLVVPRVDVLCRSTMSDDAEVVDAAVNQSTHEGVDLLFCHVEYPAAVLVLRLDHHVPARAVRQHSGALGHPI